MRNARRVVLGTIALAAIIALAAPAFGAVTIKQKDGDNEYKWQFYGFSQLEMRGGEGRGSGFSKDNDDIRFQAQRIRIGTRYIYKNVQAKLFLDFNQSFTDKSGGLVKAIKDAFVSYKFSHAAFARIGMIKTPVGMSFTVPGWNLDIAERNRLDKALVPERDMGLMLSGRLIGGPEDDPERKKINGTEMGHERRGYGFGYDIGIFNPAQRSPAVQPISSSLSVSADPDEDGTSTSASFSPFSGGDGSLLYTARLHYDHGWLFHGEIYWASQTDAGGTDRTVTITEGGDSTQVQFRSEDYSIFGFGAKSYLMDKKLFVNGEWMSAENIRGSEGRDQSTWYVTIGYKVTPQVELVAKHYSSSAERVVGGDKIESDLANTYLGVNFFLDPLKFSPRGLQSHKIVLNFIIPNGDDDPTKENYFPGIGLGGYTEDAWIMQYQVKY